MAQSPELLDHKSATERLYRPIRSWQTRIIRISPAEHPDDPIVCNLFPADIIHWNALVAHEEDDVREIQYDCLSYEWGASIFSKVVCVNGVGLPVTENLCSALTQIRNGGDTRYLWVDGICINQSDDQEKSIQVRRMLPIYQKASRVIMWIPDWVDRRGEFAEAMRKLSAAGSLYACGVSPETVQEVVNFLRQGYQASLFKRTWIRQEMFAARKVICQFGTTRLEWDEIQSWGPLIHHIQELLGRAADAEEEEEASRRKVLDTPADASYIRSPWRTAGLITGTEHHAGRIAQDGRNKKVPLAGALLASQYFECSDPRDVVYGVLGLTEVLTDTPDNRIVDAHDSPVLTIDYSLSLSRVLQSATAYIIETGSMEILYCANLGAKACGLPSWVVDWSNLHKPLVCWSEYDYRDLLPQQMCGSSSWQYVVLETIAGSSTMLYEWKTRLGRFPNWTASIQHIAQKDALRTRGVVLGTVDKVGEEFGGWRLEADYPGVTRESIADLIRNNLTSLIEETQCAMGGSLFLNNSGRRFVRLIGKRFSDLFSRGTVQNRFPLRTSEKKFIVLRSSALIPRAAVCGDLLVLLKGLTYPFVLRPTGSAFTLVGMAVFPVCCVELIRDVAGPRGERRSIWGVERFQPGGETLAEPWNTILGSRTLHESLQDFDLV